jgi:hypothetical protein
LHLTDQVHTSASREEPSNDFGDLPWTGALSVKLVVPQTRKKTLVHPCLLSISSISALVLKASLDCQLEAVLDAMADLGEQLSTEVDN